MCNIIDLLRRRYSLVDQVGQPEENPEDQRAERRHRDQYHNEYPQRIHRPLTQQIEEPADPEEGIP